MHVNDQNPWLPPVCHTRTGAERRVGIEVEFAGVDPDAAANCVRKQFGGELRSHNIFETHIVNTQVGDFLLELDTAYLKPLGEHLSQFTQSNSLEAMASEMITRAAEQFVPWEVVSPPLGLSQLPDFQQLLVELRKHGALGTRHSLHYAFGLHLNPELPDLGVETILNYLRAYFCLYDWIAEREEIDFARRLTPYIKHFDNKYIQQVVNPSYRPKQTALIADYLSANPTRNRSMDMLPLFSHLNETQVKRVVKDKRIKARPTLHYRLPNCDIDNPNWSLLNPWRNWLVVESLANEEDKLMRLCERYYRHLQSFSARFSNDWLEITEDWLAGFSP